MSHAERLLAVASEAPVAPIKRVGFEWCNFCGRSVTPRGNDWVDSDGGLLCRERAAYGQPLNHWPRR